MSNIRIFEKEKDRLFAACFEPGEPITGAKDELDKTLDFWRDIELLREFFMQYRQDLSDFEPAMKVNAAVKQARAEADGIYDRLIDFSEQDRLDELFKPLENKELEQPRYEFQKLKAKDEIRKNMLRLYAVKFRDWYVITEEASN